MNKNDNDSQRVQKKSVATTRLCGNSPRPPTINRLQPNNDVFAQNLLHYDDTHR